MGNPPVSDVVTETAMVADDQVNVGEFTSKHFDICPSAVALYKDIEASSDQL